MTKYELPSGMRYSSLREREEFYQKEFCRDIVEEWFKPTPIRNIVFAVIIGRHTRIFPPEYEEDASTTILITKHRDFADVKRQILEFRPESAYYDRNIYDIQGKILGQEMAFDLDPENLRCPLHGTLEDKMKQRQGLSFCEIELDMVKEETLRLCEELQRSFSQMRIVYSGRGFHIHVFDEKTFTWSSEKRKELARTIRNKGFPIDEWVTSGGMRLIRLPYSLHGMVSRIVTPLDVREIEGFNPITDDRCIPHFLRN